MRLVILRTSGPTDPSPIDLPGATAPHAPGTFAPQTPQAPPTRDPGSLKHPLLHTPLMPHMPQTLHSPDPERPVQLRPNTHHIPYSSDLDLGALYATCAPKTPCSIHPRHYKASVCPVRLGPCAAQTWGALQTPYCSVPVQPGLRAPYRPCMAQTLCSLDSGCPIDPVWLRPCAVWTEGAL